MVKKILITAILAFVLPITACHHIEEWDNDTYGNFDALWTVVDEHYCFFETKDIDWDAMRLKYKSRLYHNMPSQMLFEVCADMINELKDGHVNLSASFNTSYYRNWWSDYPQNYDQRLVEQYYLGFGHKSLGAVMYGTLKENVGYMHYASFSSGLGEGNIDAILASMGLCNGLIIDLRDNGGGDLTNAERLIERFLTERTLVGYMVNKTGPGHNDFSKPEPYYYEPTGDHHLLWSKPVVVLTNRSTFSAANNFVSVMQYLPNVKIVGARTGGGSGLPITLEIPNGWMVRMSSVSILDAKGQTTEFGIEPSPGCAVDLDPLAALQGKDTMIERAIEVINSAW